MLDRIDPGLDRRLDAGGAVGVRRRLAPEGVRLADDGAQLLVGELPRPQIVARRQHAAGCGDLDQVGAVLDLVADGGAALVRGIADSRLDAAAARDREVGAEGVQGVGVPAGDGDDLARGQDARAFDQPEVDGAAQRHARAVRVAHVAHGREPGAQRREGIHRAEDRLVGGRPQDRPPLPVGVHQERQVIVTVDEAGDDGAAGEIEVARTLRAGQRLLRLDRLDPVSFDQDRHVAPGRPAAAVDQQTDPDVERLRRVRGGGAGRSRRRGEQERRQAGPGDRGSESAQITSLSW